MEERNGKVCVILREKNESAFSWHSSTLELWTPHTIYSDPAVNLSSF